MNRVALRMLVGDRAKYLGIIMGLTFSSLLITQQASIFLGIVTRSYAFVTDTGTADLWIMDPKVQYIDDLKPMQDTQIQRVRGVEGLEWAVPLYKGIIRARLTDGNFQSCYVVGLDDATLIGAPATMKAGALADLRQGDAVIVDSFSAADKLAHPAETPGGRRVPLTVGDTLELNDHHARVVGLCGISRTLLAYPVIYTTYSRAMAFTPRERRLLTFILAKVRPGHDPAEVCERIRNTTGLAAWTRPDFQLQNVYYFMKYTGIPINFGIAVALGFIVGTAIAGQTFYNFTLENLRHFGTLKAMGASNGMLLRMIALQALIVGGIGYGLGVGAAALFGTVVRNTQLAFWMPPHLLLVSATAVTLICLLSALVSMRTVLRLEPAIVFKS